MPHQNVEQPNAVRRVIEKSLARLRQTLPSDQVGIFAKLAEDGRFLDVESIVTALDRSCFDDGDIQ
jgi:hypothetical protein